MVILEAAACVFATENNESNSATMASNYNDNARFFRFVLTRYMIGFHIKEEKVKENTVLA